MSHRVTCSYMYMNHGSVCIRRSWVPSPSHTHSHTHTYTHTHTYMYIHTHTHTHTPPHPLPMLFHFSAPLGLFFQWMLCIGIWLVGLAVNMFRYQPPFFYPTLLGGALWTTGTQHTGLHLSLVPRSRNGLGTRLGLPWLWDTCTCMLHVVG